MSETTTESTCRHCGRTITNSGGPNWAHIIGPGSLLIRCEPSESGKPYGLNAEPVFAQDERENI